ncbi:SDR family NAD(P)-dependent oxidoreductase [Pedobacter psychroterrae]|uniref:SDR family NAD(P)-dependent oxidoreductase n=1 Tax=Pedobacter psychroterrae TaxID=2530453 RepID=A0A4R0NLB0_9SPHI|nr:SDR family NAD(P)-dependent oxidoreductase [Pedobacter psychroterrae]TCD01551.1 SDR family NAD(P)-dependent oxidoreductase [Pedobacter psychroterrae]
MKNTINTVAVVTGAGGTLCSEMAKSLAAMGIKVALIGRDLNKLKIVEEEIKNNGGIAISISTDVTDQTAVELAEKQISAQLGKVSILINGAGGNQSEAITTVNQFDPKELETPSPDFRGFFNLDMIRFLDVIKTNSMGSIIPSFVFGKVMAKNGGGSIINIASMSSFRALSRVAAYAFAKAGMVNFTQWLGAYLAPANIRVNAIAPGFFLNERSTKLLTTPEGGFTERGASIINITPMKDFGKAPQLIGTMKYLLDNEASGFVTGITISVDGGFLASAGI